MNENKITSDNIKKRIKENLRKSRDIISINDDKLSTDPPYNKGKEIPLYPPTYSTSKFKRMLYKFGIRYADIIKSIPVVNKFAKSISLNYFNGKYKASVRLYDLLKYNGKGFITIVYKTILERDPDPEGMVFYLNACKMMMSKVEIINDILISPEGKTKGIKVLGIKKALFFKKIKKSIISIPILGRIAQLIWILWNISSYISNLQKETTISLIEIEGIQSKLASMENIHSRIDDIIAQLSVLQDLPDQVQGIQSKLASMKNIHSRIDDIIAQLSVLQDLPDQVQGIQSKQEMYDDLENQLATNKQELEDLRYLYGDLNKNYTDYRQNVAYLNRKLHLINHELKDIYDIGKDETGKRIATIDIDSYKYLAFENLYRGSRDEIKERQRQYVDYIKKAYEQSQGDYMLDAGCGRGEFLELMQEANIPAVGIDINDEILEDCRKYGLNAKVSDILEYLGSISNNSLVGLSAFQVVEHLSVDYLSEFIELSFQKIKKGGVIILETINPSTFIAMKYFWMDLSHIRPIPNETLRFLIENSGFRDISTKFSSPVPDQFKLTGDDNNIKKLNELLYGYQDYALIGWK
jgi:O-antigen chain-terminating methyltransferase